MHTKKGSADNKVWIEREKDVNFRGRVLLPDPTESPRTQPEQESTSMMLGWHLINLD